jgi:quinol monooxygenase YgiN
MNLRAGFEDGILTELAPVIECTRQLPGCLSFDWYRMTKNRRTLFLLETWETCEIRQRYLESELKAELIKLLEKALSRPMETVDVEEVSLI